MDMRIELEPIRGRGLMASVRFSALLLLGVMTVGCAGTKELHEAGAEKIPEWYTSAQDDDYFLAATTATSRDMQMSIDAAIVTARAEIGRQVQVKMDSDQERFQGEIGETEQSTLRQHFRQSINTIVSESLRGSRARHQTASRDGDVWRAFVLVEYPIGAMNKALMQQLQANNEMETRLRSTEAWQELEEKVAAYEKWKESRGR
jgi:hypothetical protein